MPSSDAESLAGRRILIVESDVTVADALTQLMTEMGHTVQLSADGRSALYELHDFDPHLVLLGTYLADMPGYELSAILKGAPQYSHKFRHVGVLYVADRNKMLKNRFSSARDVPVSQYIFKPINAVEVREKVNQALRESVVG